MEQKKSAGNDNFGMDEETLENLYAWIDGIPLSRPKKNIARDFSDGVLVAELVNHCCSKKGLVELHNYPPASNSDKKRQNWSLLNRKVFHKLNFELRDDVIEELVLSKPGAIEKVLDLLRTKLERAEWELKRNPPKPERSKGGGSKKESDKPEADQYLVLKGSVPWYWESDLMDRDWIRGKKAGSPRFKGQQKLETQRGDIDLQGVSRYKQKVIHTIGESDSVPRLLMEEKQQECLAKAETIQILEAKISRLEHLLHLKDIRIDDLQSRLETMRPTGLRR